MLNSNLEKVLDYILRCSKRTMKSTRLCIENLGEFDANRACRMSIGDMNLEPA